METLVQVSSRMGGKSLMQGKALWTEQKVEAPGPRLSRKAAILCTRTVNRHRWMRRES